jgi:hypothetical protein
MPGDQPGVELEKRMGFYTHPPLQEGEVPGRPKPGHLSLLGVPAHLLRGQEGGEKNEGRHDP